MSDAEFALMMGFDEDSLEEEAGMEDEFQRYAMETMKDLERELRETDNLIAKNGVK
jgi:hypothetical protein